MNLSELFLIVTGHGGDAISPGGFVRVVWAVEPCSSITNRPHGFIDVVRSLN